MKVCIVVASVNELVNIKKFGTELESDVKLIVIDEGNRKLRRRNDKLLKDIDHTFYGPSERREWFKKHFGSDHRRYLSVIPERCHAETSFGFLLAYEEQADMVLELDDDVFPLKDCNIISSHKDNLFNNDGSTVYANGRWYNSMENLKLNIDAGLYPRGHPYAQECRVENYRWTHGRSECVLNMGLWNGNPDLDALTILYNRGLDGRCSLQSKASQRRKVIVGKRVYFAVCSMNTSFQPKIIPAFYQLYMNYLGVDRFDDIWSGIFLKKIADHLGDKVCLGEPLVYHNKRPRDTFDDLKKELDGMIINEKLWRMVDEAELDGKTYQDAYGSLIHELEKRFKGLQNSIPRKFLKTQAEKMKSWLEIFDKIK